VTFRHQLAPLRLGDLLLRNHIVMAPCTRCRCPGFLPTAEVAAYYARRAADGVGLLISEGTVVCERGNGYNGAPGIWTDDQVRAWRPVTEAVHEAEGLIICQLWHVGAVAHPLTTGGVAPESPSGLHPPGAVSRLRDEAGAPIPFGPSEAMDEERIREVVRLFGDAAGRALEAGFDGVEIHGAHGYLIDQFINLKWNHRTDDWGGDQRCRLAGEVTRTVLAETGPGRTLLRFSPGWGTPGSGWQRPAETLPLLLDTLWEAGLRLLHASHGSYDEGFLPAAALPIAHPLHNHDTLVPLHLATRARWPGQVVGVGGLSPARAESALAADEIDAAAFGRALIANPDLVSRIKMGIELREYDQSMLDRLV
jgi:2,4-dienoyl-CoA reductase-like NADH-dependent reductase (Old Yellow Enzyme family)